MSLPPVPESFYWTRTECGWALKCRALEQIAPHLFTTRELALSGDGWRCVGAALQAETVVTVKQVHGRGVVVVRSGVPRAEVPPDGDVLVSNDPAAAVAVRAADCVPLLLADSATGAVAAVHAGWRGTAAGAATAAVEALAREFGSKPQHLVVAIGPSIGACCYTVGSELMEAFAAAGHSPHCIDRWFVQGQPVRLDLIAANRDQLQLAGVPDTQIHASELCTAMNLDVLTSYRAEKERAGRISGVIRCRTTTP